VSSSKIMNSGFGISKLPLKGIFLPGSCRGDELYLKKSLKKHAKQVLELCLPL